MIQTDDLELEYLCSNLKFDSIESYKSFYLNIRKESKLKILQINADSIITKPRFDKFDKIFSSISSIIHIIIISETHLTKAINIHLNRRLKDYVSIFASRPHGDGGGLAVYVYNTMQDNLKVITNSEENSDISSDKKIDKIRFQKIHLSLKNVILSNSETEPETLNILAYYRPPNPKNVEDFMSDLDKSLNKIENQKCLIVGDMNFSWIEKRPNYLKDVENYKLLLRSHNFHCCNTNVTRYKAQSILDLVVSNFSELKHHHTDTIYHTLSDHNIVITDLKMSGEFHFIELYDIIRIIIMKKTSLECLYMEESGDINTFFNYYNTALGQKLQPKTISTTTITKHEKKFFNYDEDRCKTIEEVCKNINKILGRSLNKSEINDIFNDKEENIEEAVTSPLNSNEANTKPEDSISLNVTDYSNEVLSIIKKIDSSFVNFNEKEIRELKALSHQLGRIFNTMIDTNISVYPDALKQAIVVPSFKEGENTDINNCRPIPILAIFDEVFGNLLFERMYNFLHDKNFFYKFQYGLRPKSNKLTAVAELVNSIGAKVDSNNVGSKVVTGLFLDLSKGCDTVNFEILARKLESAGIVDKPKQLVMSYITKRSQLDILNNGIKNIISEGLPKNNLGQLLYLIYINDMGNLGLHGKLQLYIDECALLYADNNVNVNIANMELDMKIITDYFIRNTLTINIKNSKFIHFHNFTKKLYPTNIITFGGEQVKIVKYLDMYFDSHLTYKYHIDTIAKKVSKMVGLIIKYKDLLTRNILLKMYYQLIHYNLNYMIIIWGSVKGVARENAEKKAMENAAKNKAAKKKAKKCAAEESVDEESVAEENTSEENTAEEIVAVKKAAIDKETNLIKLQNLQNKAFENIYKLELDDLTKPMPLKTVYKHQLLIHVHSIWKKSCYYTTEYNFNLNEECLKICETYRTRIGKNSPEYNGVCEYYELSKSLQNPDDLEIEINKLVSTVSQINLQTT